MEKRTEPVNATEWTGNVAELGQELRGHEGYPCVTLTMPTARNMPDNAQDPIRLKNLLSEAENRLQDELGKRPAEATLQNLRAAAESVDHNLNFEGLAIFANDQIGTVLKTRFPLTEALLVDTTFSMRTLLRAERRAEPYSVMVLSLDTVRLFEGTRDTLVEIREDFPANNSGHGAGSKAPGGIGVNTTSAVDESRRRFVHECFVNCAQIEGLPPKMVVMGTPEILSEARSSVQSPIEIVAEVGGNYLHSNLAELGGMAWEAVRTARRVMSEEVIEQLGMARSENKFAGGIQEVVALAREGRIARLVCAMEYQAAGHVDEETGGATLLEEPSEWNDQDDLVEYAIQHTIEKGGDVRFVPDELMEDVMIAAILRY